MLESIIIALHSVNYHLKFGKLKSYNVPMMKPLLDSCKQVSKRCSDGQRLRASSETKKEQLDAMKKLMEEIDNVISI